MMKELVDIQCFIYNKLNVSINDADYIKENSGSNHVKIPSSFKCTQDFLDNLSEFIGLPIRTDQTSEYTLISWG